MTCDVLGMALTNTVSAYGPSGTLDRHVISACALIRLARNPDHDCPARAPAAWVRKPILAGGLPRLAHCLSALPAALAAIARARCCVQPNRAYPRPPRRKPHASP